MCLDRTLYLKVCTPEEDGSAPRETRAKTSTAKEAGCRVEHGMGESSFGPWVRVVSDGNTSRLKMDVKRLLW